MLDAAPAYSYRDDRSVPDFDDAYALAVMDGDCALCSASARLILRRDRRDRIRITTAQSPLGAALLRHYGLEPHDPETWLYLENGVAYGSLDGVMRISKHLGWISGPIGALRFLPVAVQNWIYLRIARNRYGLFGRGDMCAIPDPLFKAKLVE
jgi:predicted DCC family thiol-disulfide oxidoreductase YuxK